jgi:class 3 adenylate cyclase
MNLVFVPLLSTYGLRVCPVLSIAGFWFGCAYAGMFIFLVSLFNIPLIFGLPQILNHRFVKGRAFFVYIGTYFVATAAALVVLDTMLKLNHLSQSSRGPEILAFASLLLGITQAYGMSWVQAGNAKDNSEPRFRKSFKKLWILHSVQTLLPILIALGVLIHFQLSQSVGFTEGNTAAVVDHDMMIYQTVLVVLFLMLWLFITFAFHFLTEGNYALAVQKHLKHLENLNTDFRSRLAGDWSLWTELLSQLNDFSKALAERGRLLNSFSKFVSASVAKQALNIDLKQTAGISMEKTILISDIRNFTSLSESLQAHQIVGMLNQYFTAMLEILVRYQINVDKFIGDGILAYVETSTYKDDNADEENQLAVSAALAMEQRLKDLNASFKEQNIPAIEIGIGIYRGPVIVGLIGSDTKLQHTIIGDSVNRTARLEGLCKDLQASLLVSEEVWSSVSNAKFPEFKSFGKKTVRGIKDPIGVYGIPR